MSIQDLRLSQAFPPNSLNNSKFISDIHNRLQVTQHDPSFQFRPIKTKKDIQQLKALQQEWFPIQYTDAFYKQALDGITSSLLIEMEIKYHTGRREKLIIGAVIYQVRPCKGRYFKWSEWRDWLWNVIQPRRCLYVMTLGVINEFRGQGLAQKLIQHLKDKCIQENYAYVYLDVVAYNKVARKFYKKNGFQNVRRKHNHYDIEGQHYDAIVYLWKPLI